VYGYSVKESIFYDTAKHESLPVGTGET